MSEAAGTGVPVVRHMAVEFPEDPASVDLDYQYMLGPYLLVAPVVEEGALERLVHLPEGAWYDFWTHEGRDGGADVAVPAALGEIPVFVRAGALLPRLPDGVRTLAGTKDPDLLSLDDVWESEWVLEVFLGSETSFILADGTTCALAAAGAGSDPGQPTLDDEPLPPCGGSGEACWDAAEEVGRHLPGVFALRVGDASVSCAQTPGARTWSVSLVGLGK